MTPLETKATDALLAAADELVWSRTSFNRDEWIAEWRGVKVRVNGEGILAAELYVGRWLVAGYDASPIEAKIMQLENKAYKALLRSLAGGVE